MSNRLIQCMAMTFVVTFILTSIAIAQDLKIQIDYPKDGAEVGLNSIIKGKISSKKGSIYLLVHPMLTNLWWVQNIPSPPNRDGSWRTIAYFGTATKGKGEFFEVIAIVTDKNLKVGQTLAELPENSILSDIILLQRTK